MIEVINWNPREVSFRGRRIPRVLGSRIGRPVNNFGDLLGPLIVRSMLDQRRLTDPGSRRRLLTVGSILHMARTGDVVWGSGWNGDLNPRDRRFEMVDLRAVRGPMTADLLARRGGDAPRVFGDPALLLPLLLPDLGSPPGVRSGALFIPNIRDRGNGVVPDGVRLLSPTGDPFAIVRAITASSFVIASSLHAVIVADAFGVEARLVRTEIDPFKYADHYLGTGRPDFRMADSVSHALRLGGEPSIDWNPEPLLGSFPDDLFSPAHPDWDECSSGR